MAETPMPASLPSRGDPRPRRGGVVVGTWHDGRRTRWLYDTSDRHVFVFAPSGAGKTSCLVVPTLLSWPHSVIALDIKSELWRLTSGYRERALGNVCLRFDPASADGTAARYNPLFAISRTSQDVATAQAIAERLIDVKPESHEPFFRESAHNLLVGAMLHVLYAETDKTLAGCGRFLANPELDLEQRANRMLAALHDPDRKLGWRSGGRETATHPVVQEVAATFLDMPRRTAGDILSTLLNPLALYRDPDVARNTSTSDFTAADLVSADRPVSLYLTIAPGNLGRLRALLRLVLSQITRELTLPENPGRRRPLLLLLDEFTALEKLDFLHREIAYLRSFGIRVFISIQTLSQLRQYYGEHESISANCGTQVAYGANDVETARRISEMTGVFTVEFDQRSVSGSGFGGTRATDSRGHTQRPLLTPDEVRRLPADQSLVFVSGHPPIRGTRLPYFRSPALAARASLPPAKGDPTRLGHDDSYWTGWAGHIPQGPVQDGPGRRRRTPPRGRSGRDGLADPADD